METRVCRSPDETFELGASLADRLRPGDTLLLHGGLGAGKTLFVKGVMGGLGFDIDEVTSPSFTLVNRYDAAAATVYHVDLWRLEPGAGASVAVGLDELLESGDAIVLIEWADHLSGRPPATRCINVNIEGVGDDPRTISIEAFEAENVT